MVQSLHLPKRIVDISIGLPDGTARSFQKLYCAFETRSWAKPKPNTATTKIYNLSEDSIRYLEQKNMVLTVNAGVDIAGQLFQGAISRDGVGTTNQAQDWVTAIKAADGRRSYRDAIFNRSYPPGTPARQMVSDIASAMGKPVVFAATFPDFTTTSGMCFVEKARTALDQVLLPYDLRWSIISGVLYILDQSAALPGNSPEITPESGLHGSPERTKKGVKFKCDLNPAVIAGRATVLHSRLWSGTIRNDEVIHRGNTWGTVWETKAQGVKI